MTALATETATTTDTLASDLLEGSAAIAGFTGKTKRQVDHMLETRQLPGAFKLGGRWHMRKSTYLRHIERLEAEAMQAA